MRKKHIHSSPFCLANEVLRCWSSTGGLFCYLQIVWNGCEYITVACKCANAEILLRIPIQSTYIRIPYFMAGAESNDDIFVTQQMEFCIFISFQ